MPLPALADVSELEARLGTTLSGADLGRAMALLDDASALIRQEAGEDWVDDHGDLEDVPAAVATICLAVAYRAFKNPDGVTQASLGDASVSYGRAGLGSSVYLNEHEVKAVRRAAGKSGALSVALATPYYERATPAPGDEWWEVYD